MMSHGTASRGGWWYCSMWERDIFKGMSNALYQCSVPNVDGSIGGGGGGGGGMRVAYSRIERRNSATSEHARVRVKATRGTGCWVHSPQLRHTSATLARGNCSHAPSSSHPIPSSTPHTVPIPYRSRATSSTNTAYRTISVQHLRVWP